jgi:4-hydroxybenzoate polyprenyltransferase
VTFEKAIYILPVCLIFTNWEVVRKIRAPEQETAYTTYSKIFGAKPSILIALVIQLIFVATVYNIFEIIGTNLILKSIFLALQAILISPSLYFLFTLKLPRPLKPFAEAQILVVVISLLAAALL